MAREFRVTLGLTICALAIHASPALQLQLQFDRPAIIAGDIWRIVTGHFTHWTAELLLWDVSVFIGLGIACERCDRGRTIRTIVASAIAIPIALLIAQPSLESYRGLSGIDSALFALLAVLQMKNRSFTAIVFLAAFAGKSVYELATGHALFIDTTASGFVPVPLAHIIGGGCGAIAGLWPFAHWWRTTTIART